MIRQPNTRQSQAYHPALTAELPEYLQVMSAGYKFQFAGTEAKGVTLTTGELLKLTGPAIFLNKISGNGRRYIPESVHAQVAELIPRIEAKALFGELDHPPVQDLMRLAYVKATEVSHRIDRIWWVEAEQAYHIEVTILDTPNGRILKTMHDTGSPMYVSLRSLLDPNRGIQQSGFTDAWISALITIDFVTRPGFADAILSPMGVGTESMFAVCESLNIITRNNEHNVSKTNSNSNELNKYTKTNLSNRTNMKNYAIESIAGDKTKASDSFQANVNSIILKIQEDFPKGFGFDEFHAEYEGVIKGKVATVYGDSAELLIKNPSEGVDAVVQLSKTAEDNYVILANADVTYCKSDALLEDEDEDETATESYNRPSMYAIVATENYTPADTFIDAVTSIHNRLSAEFPNGFSKDEYDDVEDVATDGNDFDVSVSKEQIEITCSESGNGARITLSEYEGKHKIMDISEYFESGAGKEIDESAVEAIMAAASFRWNNGGKEQYAVESQSYSTDSEADVESILENARQRWNNGGKERYAAIEAENEPKNSGIVNADNMASATAMQPFQVIEDDEDDEDDEDGKEAAKKGMYDVIEEDGVQQTYSLDTDEDLEKSKKPETKKPETKKSKDSDDYNRDDIAAEAARIFGMPNSKFEGNYAIEHMPTAYKHIWAGLTPTAKNIIANQTEHVATESECLSFWQNTNFVAIEQAVLRTGTTELTSGLEAIELKDPRMDFFGGILPSRKSTVW